MSKHSEIVDNSPEKRYLECFCRDRWGRMSDPCRGCKYRYPLESSDGRCCIFPSVPKDWALFEYTENARPVEDVKPSASGRWIKKFYHGAYRYECSECGGAIPRDQWGHDWFSRYCPNCGIYMEE
jgi:hypothetical protein